jgi:hypothetical protein
VVEAQGALGAEEHVEVTAVWVHCRVSGSP